MYKGKTIIITGASSGIGKDIAISFLEKGANIVINARNKSRLEELSRNFSKYISRIKIVAGDIITTC